jgi:hypothetical protein
VHTRCIRRHLYVIANSPPDMGNYEILHIISLIKKYIKVALFKAYVYVMKIIAFRIYIWDAFEIKHLNTEIIF